MPYPEDEKSDYFSNMQQLDASQFQAQSDSGGQLQDGYYGYENNDQYGVANRLQPGGATVQQPGPISLPAAKKGVIVMQLVFFGIVACFIGSMFVGELFGHVADIEEFDTAAQKLGFSVEHHDIPGGAQSVATLDNCTAMFFVLMSDEDAVEQYYELDGAPEGPGHHFISGSSASRDHLYVKYKETVYSATYKGGGECKAKTEALSDLIGYCYDCSSSPISTAIKRQYMRFKYSL